MSPDDNTTTIIVLLASIADTLSEFGNETKGVSQYIAAKGDLNRISQIISSSDELNLEQKTGMAKLTNFLGSEIDKKLIMFNSTQI
jgi:hypothetical protein